MPRKTLRDSDEEDTIEEKGSQSKPRKNRLDKDESLDESDAIVDWRKKLALRKRADEAAEEGEARRDTSSNTDDIQEQHSADIGKDDESKAESCGSPLLRRGINKNRFDHVEDTGPNEDQNTVQGVNSVLVVHTASTPWIPLQKRIAEEHKIYFCVDGDGQIGLSTSARVSMKDQGLYVSRKSLSLSHNIERSILRSRVRAFPLSLERFEGTQKVLSLMNPKSWLGSILSSKELLKERFGSPLNKDEMIFVAPFEPFKDQACRPAMRFDPSLPYMQYSMPVPVVNLEAVLGRADANMVLELDINGLTITDHPLFIEEDYLACDLVALYRKYKQRAEANWVGFCTKKLEALYAALENCRIEQDLVSGTALHSRELGVFKETSAVQSIKEEIRHLRLQRAQDETDDLSIISRMIQVWERLKKIRKTQGFASTKVDLKFKQRKMDPETDKKMREEELEAELDEMEQKYLMEKRALQEKFMIEKHKLVKLVEDAQKSVDVVLTAEKEAREALTAEESSSSDEDNEIQHQNALPKRTSSRLAANSRSDVASHPLASTHIVRQRMEEEEKLKAARLLLDDHNRQEATILPIPFDYATNRSAIMARQELTRRAVGSPMYEPILKEDPSVRTESASLPPNMDGAREKKRRERIKALQFSVRILVNGRYLRHSDGLAPLEISLKPRGKDFDFAMQACEVIQLVSTSKLPELALQVFEGRNIARAEIATILIPQGADSPDDRGEPITFQGLKPWGSESSSEPTDSSRKHDNSAAVGLHKSVVPIKQHFHSGEFFLRLRLPDNVEEEKNPNAKMTISGGGLISISKLKSMIKLNQIDPNDPRNSHLLEVLNSSKDIGYDQLLFDPLQYSLFLGEHVRFATKNGQARLESKKKIFGEQLISCPATMRHKILMARERGVTFGGPSWPQCAIPLLDSEVEEVLWDEFFDKVYAADIPPDEVEDVPMDKQRKEKILRFQNKVQEQFRKARARQAGGIKRKYKLRDVVHQPELPELRPFAIMEALRHLFRKRATLRPEQKKNRIAERMPSQCNIRITVQRAYNLPQRRLDLSSSNAAIQDSASPGGEANILECMVQARFQNKEAATPIFKGSSPAWNAPLTLPFQPPGNDWTPGKLLKVTDNLHLNVFDTKVWEKSDGQSSSRKVEKRWLGNIKIPFTTILNNPFCRIDGIFELDSAAHSIGYSSYTPSGNNAKPGTKAVAAKIQEAAAVSTPKSSSILVCIALDPPLQQPGVGSAEIAGRLENPLLDQCVCTWINSCKSYVHCRTRTYDALARCLKRDWVLITRYIQPCIPPDDAYNTDLSLEVQMLQLCRFVSLVPFLEDWNIDDEGTDDEIPSIWFTSKEFIVDVGAGDWEEHATLLCNFFLHLGKQAYLVFGTGTPEGKTVYVMTVDDSSQTGVRVAFWNAVKGKRYDCKDPLCTLKEIFYVVNKDNVWGNIQPAHAIASTSFNFEDPLQWRPLLSPKFKAQSAFASPQLYQTVQTEIDWKRSPPKEPEAIRIEQDFNSTIQTVLEHWRSNENLSTNGNEGLNRRLREVLKKMEEAAHFKTPFNEEQLHQELKGYLNEYHVTGFHINRPYTEIDGLLEEIHHSDIHHCGPVQNQLNESDVKFSHAVYVKAFSRKIFSVWIAVACLSRKLR